MWIVITGLWSLIFVVAPRSPPLHAGKTNCGLNAGGIIGFVKSSASVKNKYF